MTKINFLLLLNEKLSALPPQEVEERLTFYCEMIEDRMEEGLAEEEAVAAVGTVDEIAAQIVTDAPPTEKPDVPPKMKRPIKVWEIVLLVLGSPIWVSLLVTAFAVILSLYVSLWAVIVSLWAAFASVAVSSLCSIVLGVIVAFVDNGLAGMAAVSAGIVCIGLAIFLFFGCTAITKGAAALTKLMGRWMKSFFPKKEVRHA